MWWADGWGEVFGGVGLGFFAWVWWAQKDMHPTWELVGGDGLGMGVGGRQVQVSFQGQEGRVACRGHPYMFFLLLN